VSPTFSILTVVIDAAPDNLRAWVATVRAQDYPHFELCLVAGSSMSPDSREVLDRAVRLDPRIRVISSPEKAGVVAASNVALAAATGTFVVLLTPGEVLVPRALGVLNHFLAIAGNDEVDVAYTDDEVRTVDGIALTVNYKPDWSPERLRSHFYCGPTLVVRRSLVDSVGGFRPGSEGALEYDLALRAAEQARQVLHVAEVLSRSGHYFMSSRAGADMETRRAAQQAVSDHCERVGIAAEVTMLDNVEGHRLRRRVTRQPRVSVIIPTCGTAKRIWGRERVLVVEAVRSVVERSTYRHLEFIIVADRITPSSVIDDLREILGAQLKLIWFDGPFNFSRKINIGAAHATGEFLLMMNDDMEVITPDWIEEMLGLAQDPGVGMVGSKLLFADGTLQHAGQYYGDSRPHHTFHHYPADFAGPGDMLQVTRECTGVTAACALIPAAVWHHAGGLTEALPNNYNDADLCLKVRHLGYRILWTPHAQLYHFESMTRESTVNSDELAFIQRRWDTQLRTDPYGNPNLDPRRADWIPREVEYNADSVAT
jgi:O-antigen biosynthesis protein